MGNDEPSYFYTAGTLAVATAACWTCSPLFAVVACSVFTVVAVRPWRFAVGVVAYTYKAK